MTLFSWQCDLFLLLLNYISFSCKNVNHINSNDDDVYAEQKLIEWSKKAWGVWRGEARTLKRLQRHRMQRSSFSSFHKKPTPPLLHLVRPRQRKSKQGHALRQMIKLVLPITSRKWRNSIISFAITDILQRQRWSFQRLMRWVMKCCENYSKLVCEPMKNWDRSE